VPKGAAVGLNSLRAQTQRRSNGSSGSQTQRRSNAAALKRSSSQTRSGAQICD
jgi:hypothetical protein